MPPNCSGMVMPKSPISRAIRTSSSGIASCSSIQRARGSTSFSTKRRTSSHKRCTSGERFFVTINRHPYLVTTISSLFRLDESIRRLHALALGKDEERIDVELAYVILQVYRQRGKVH